MMTSIRPPRCQLPIDSLLPELMQYLEGNPFVILQATPGSGKTTRVPPALLNARFLADDQEIWVLEPRRLAAKYAAHRVAQELGEPVGQSVGYHFRFEKVTGPKTRLHFLTEGMLIRKLIANPRLEQVGAVILDEFHERHLHGDSALAYLAHLQATERPDLRVLVMSATLDAEAICGFLRNCSIFKIETTLFPISIHHLPEPISKPLEITIKETVLKAIREEGPENFGDYLIFLPGMAEIRKTQAELERVLSDSFVIFPLHGDLSREEQDRAIQPLKGQRKIILSTNVAETSITIEGLRTVIDSGLHRVASFSWWSGVPSLRTRPISRASAIQRAGRAGRTAPGRCYRLYTQSEFASRPAFETPEIQRADLCQTVLELKSLGIDDFEKFAWFEAPSSQALNSAQELLYFLGALDQATGPCSLTPIGKRMVSVPAHPRIARLLIEAEKQGVLSQASTLGAMITHGLETSTLSDPMDQIDFAGRNPSLQKTQSQLFKTFPTDPDAQAHHSKRFKNWKDSLRYALLTSFPDRIARKRLLSSSISRGTSRDGAQMAELIFSAGGSALVPHVGVMTESETFITLDLQEQQAIHQTRSQLKVRSVTPILPEWLLDLEPSVIKEKTETSWDTSRDRVKTVSRLTYGALILVEDETASDPKKETEVLLKSALGLDPNRFMEMTLQDWVQALTPVSEPELLENTIGRIALAQKYVPELVTHTSELSQSLMTLLEGKSRLSELKELDWESVLLFEFFSENRSKAEMLFPSQISLTPKRRVKIHYPLNQAPWIESRLQDFFGMKKGPAILQGKLPLTLHLLAPNQRAVQVTTDLQGFWQRTYPELRTALSRRYPRHFWPENPLAPEQP